MNEYYSINTKTDVNKNVNKNDIKNRTYFFLDDVINIRNFDLN